MAELAKRPGVNISHVHHYFESKETKNDRSQLDFHRVRGSVKVLSAVIGASVVVAMGAVDRRPYPGNEVGSERSKPKWLAQRQQLPGRRRRRHLRRPSPPPHNHRHPMSPRG